jgi:phospholipid transport system transporter-binding protein
MIVRDGSQLRVQGPLTMANIVTMQAAGAELLTGADLVIDLAAVTDVDSSALSLLLEWQREARRRNLRLTFRSLPENLKSLAALYDVADLVAPEA